MSIADRTARTVWQGSIGAGSGSVTSGSGALGTLPVTWAARTEQPGGKTSPEELLAAAHSSCFSMALAVTLGQKKLTPTSLDVQAKVTLDEVDGKPTITTSAITVVGTVPGVDAAGFQAIIDDAAKLCPVSRLFAGATITVEARLA
ncbi:MAG TPA: OsmC family peroxiredoxin [Microbacteriaceae bacterium]|nr:OsmC family peroxiredoxin [Microbacteriaceae bacterium]